jgi:hypothetical protein
VPGAPVHTAPPPAKTPKPAGTPHPVSLSIVSIDPAKPLAGQRVTLSYVVRNLAPGTVLAHLSATVAGGFPQTAGGKPPVDTAYLGNQEVKGTFVLSAMPAGSDVVELTLSSTPCGPTAAASPSCAATIFAQASTTVAVAAPPTTRVRIAGTSYADINTPIFASSGYAFVVHDPGCHNGFDSGQNGNDSFFKKKDLPPGATLRAIDFSMYRIPPTLKTQYYAGGVGGYGSYGTKVVHDSGNAMHVHWENACHGPYSGYPVVYSISFEIDVPKGVDVDLGESASDATQQPYPPTTVYGPDGLAYTAHGVVSGATNAAAATIPEPSLIELAWNGEAYSNAYAPAPAGTVSAIYNNDPYPIILIADSRLGAGCVPDGNVVLAGHQTTTAAQLASLYGSSSVHTPKTFTACSTSKPTDTKTDIIVTLSFLSD